MLFPESNSQRDVGNISKITDNKCNYQNAHSIPGSPSHPTACIAQVYESAWWMMLYGSITPKRHIAWSNARTVKVLDLSRLLREVKERMSSKVRKSSKTYRNRRGGKSFVGTRHLRATQILESKNQHVIYVDVFLVKHTLLSPGWC
jgi:hypothetical protein